MQATKLDMIGWKFTKNNIGPLQAVWICYSNAVPCLPTGFFQIIEWATLIFEADHKCRDEQGIATCKPSREGNLTTHTLQIGENDSRIS
jgi:hypothetical protein